MGMAASQARFLGLTARKTNVEYEGQQINQQRTALSNKTASYYTDLLGMAVPVCPSVQDFTQTIYSFDDGSLHNSITSLIARGDGSYVVSYLSSYTDDFSIVAAGATSVVNNSDKGYYVGGYQLKELGEDLKYDYILREGTSVSRLYEDGDDYTYTDSANNNKRLINADYDVITSIIGPEPRIEDYSVGPLIENYKNTQCYNSVDGSMEGMYHLEHNLCRLMWSDGTTSITSSKGVTLTQTAVEQGSYSLTVSMGNSDTTDQTSIDLQAALKSFYPDLYQNLIDNYIDAVMYLDHNNHKINPAYYTLSSTAGAENIEPAQLYTDWDNSWTDISTIDYSEPYEEDHAAWQAEYDKYDGKYLDSEDYTKAYTFTERQMFYDGEDEYLKSLSSDQLERLYYDEVNYREMLDKMYGKPEDSWYVRYKLNSSRNVYEPIFYNGDDIVKGFRDENNDVRTTVDTYKIGAKDINNEIKGKPAFLEQDSTGRYINITFVEENGNNRTYALTTSTVTDDKAYQDAMNQYEFDKAVYDKTIQEINAKIEIIQCEDKDLELRLKQLDTEQDAISNELDAVQKVIEKNVESSFKTFG